MSVSYNSDTPGFWREWGRDELVRRARILVENWEEDKDRDPRDRDPWLLAEHVGALKSLLAIIDQREDE